MMASVKSCDLPAFTCNHWIVHEKTSFNHLCDACTNHYVFFNVPERQCNIYKYLPRYIIERGKRQDPLIHF